MSSTTEPDDFEQRGDRICVWRRGRVVGTRNDPGDDLLCFPVKWGGERVLFFFERRRGIRQGVSPNRVGDRRLPQ